MQFSLPVLPFDPGLAKAGTNAAAPSRLNDAKSSTSDADFGDLLPADPRPAPQSKLSDKNPLGLGVAKRSIKSTDDSDAEQTEAPADENDDSNAQDESGNWAIANGFVQRFVTSTPQAASTPVLIGEASQANAEEGSEAVSEEIAGGKAAGLTQPMPATAQGDGRARAILNRAERKAFVVPNAETPVSPTPAEITIPGSTAIPAVTETPTEAVPTSEAVGLVAADPVEISEATNASATEQEEIPANEVTEEVETSIQTISTDATEASVETDRAVSTQTDPSSATTTSDETAPNLFELTAAQVPVLADSTTSSSATLAEDGIAPALASVEMATAAETTPEALEEGVGDAASVRGKGVPSGKPFPLSDAEKLSDSPGLANAAEKFAAGFERRRGVSLSRGNNAELKSVKADKEDVATGSIGLGINVAKTQLSMAASATNSDTSSSLAPATTTSAVSAASALSTQTQNETQEATPMSAARRAVESAIAMAEHFTGGEHRSVNLQFSVSGVDLAVRVQLRGDAVHTTFRTDSPELRAALAHEWQVVNAQSSDRPVRLADPVFASNSNGSATQSDTNSSQHRESAARGQFGAEQFAGFRSSGRAAQNAATTAPTVVAHEPVSTSGRLRTFA